MLQTNLSSAAEILYLKSELHYLSVVTTQGSELVLFSLKQAIDQLAAIGIAGLQCHRGYWVADAAVQSAERRGRQAVLLISNGDEVPVSRANVVECVDRFGLG